MSFATGPLVRRPLGLVLVPVLTATVAIGPHRAHAQLAAGSTSRSSYHTAVHRSDATPSVRGRLGMLLGSQAPQGQVPQSAKPSAVSDSTVLVYRGTDVPHVPQISHALRARNDRVISDEVEGFLTFSEAKEHAFHGRGHHPDGVSASTSLKAASTYGAHVVEYAIPKPLFERLPTGDGNLEEVVFKHAIPEKYRTGRVISKNNAVMSKR